MNQRGQILQISAFVVAILLTGLFIVMGEPVIDAMLDITGFAGEGSTPRLIIMGASIIMLLAGIWFLTRSNEQVGFHA